MTPRELAERHFRDRPLKSLDDDELYVLNRLGDAIGPVLKPELADTVYGLLDLVMREQGERP